MVTSIKHDAFLKALNTFTYFVFLTTLIFTTNLFAQDYVAVNLPDEGEPTVKSVPAEQIEFNSLTGDWWGTRTLLYKSGYEFSFSVKNDYISTFTKNERGNDYLNLFDFNALLDLNELLSWNDATFFVQVVGINGSSPERHCGAIQGISNIASPQQWRLYQVWIEKTFADNSLSVLAGLFDLNSEFDVRSTTGLFLNPSWGIGADFAFSGLNGPSIYPSTSMAIRINYDFNENYSLRIGAFDAIPGNYDEAYLTHVFNYTNDGLLIVGEASYSEGEDEVREGFGKYSIGGWYYPQSYDDLEDSDEFGNPTQRFGNGGIYLNAEKFLCSKPGSSNLGLSAFGRLGFANKNINAVQTFWGFGFNLSGVFSDNPEEVLGFAVANARFSNKFAVNHLDCSSGPKFNETIFELTYSFNVLNWVRIQPDLQYVINPAESNYERAFIAGLRMEIGL